MSTSETACIQARTKKQKEERIAAKERQEKKNAKRNVDYIRDGLAAATQDETGGGGAPPRDAAAMDIVDITSPTSRNQGELIN